MGRQSLLWANRFSTVWRILYSILLEGTLSLVAVPPGWEALLRQQGTDLVAVVPLVSQPYARFGKIPQQHVGTGAVAALPFTEVKADRASFPVPYPMELAGQDLWCDPSTEVQRPLFEPGGGATYFGIGGIHHQHLFWRYISLWPCASFRLCGSGIGPTQRRAAGIHSSPTSCGNGCRGLCRVHQPLKHPRPSARP